MRGLRDLGTVLNKSLKRVWDDQASWGRLFCIAFATGCQKRDNDSTLEHWTVAQQQFWKGNRSERTNGEENPLPALSHSARFNAS